MTRSIRNATALEWHLTANLHPAITPAMVGPAQAAIDAMAADQPDRIITINGHTVMDGQPITAARIVTDLHLEGFLP